MSEKKAMVEVPMELMSRARQVREYANACNQTIKELIDRGVEVEFFHNGNKLPDGVFGMDFEIRMTLPQEPIQL